MAGTTADKLAYLNGTRDILKTNLIAQGMDVTSETTFRRMAELVSSIKYSQELVEVRLRSPGKKEVNIIYALDGTPHESHINIPTGNYASLELPTNSIIVMYSYKNTVNAGGTDGITTRIINYSSSNGSMSVLIITGSDTIYL